MRIKTYSFLVPAGLDISNRDAVIATLNRIFSVSKTFIGAGLMDRDTVTGESVPTYIRLKYTQLSRTDPNPTFTAWDLRLDPFILDKTREEEIEEAVDAVVDSIQSSADSTTLREKLLRLASL